MLKEWKKVKLILALALITTQLFTFAGCAKGSSATGNATKDSSATDNTTSTDSASSKKNAVTIKYTYWGGDLEKKTTDALVKNFEAQYPNIKVDAQQISTDYLTKLNTMAAGNELPDVAYMSESALLQWNDMGMFIPLSELYSEEESAKKLDSVQFKDEDGKIISTSVSDEIMVLYYNKDLFKEAGIETPPADAKNAWTWDEMIKVAQKLTTDANGKHPTDAGFDPENIVTYGINVPTTEMTWMSFVMSNGGGLVSKDGKELLFGSDATIEALQAIADLANVYHVCPSPAQASSVPTVDTALLTKKVAMSIDGQWSCQTLGEAAKTESLNFGIGVLPKFKDAVTVNAGTGIVLFDGTKHKEEAKIFAQYLMDPNNSMTYIEEGLWMPNEKDWYTSEDLINKWTGNNNQYHPAEYKTAVIDYALNNTVQMPWYYTSKYQKMVEIIDPALDKVWYGEDTAEHVVKNDIMPQLEQIFK